MINKRNPLVSVIIPNYNHARYLEKRIDSVLRQTYKNIEVIILDDASLDNSRQIIDQYQNDKLISTVVLNDVNSGSTFVQWQLGLSKANGDLIWIAESDDFCEINFLEDLVAMFKDNIVLAFAQSYFIDANENVNYFPTSKKLYDFIKGVDFQERYMLDRNSIYNMSACIWKKTCYQNVSDEFLKYKFCGDWIFLNEMIVQGDVAICGKYYNYYRKHNNTVSSRTNSSGLAFREWILALKYLTISNNIFRKNKENLLKKMLNDNYLNPNFFKIYKEVTSTDPQLKLKWHTLRILLFQMIILFHRCKSSRMLNLNP